MVDRRFHFWRDFLYERFTLEIRIRMNWCIYEVFTFEGLKGFISEILKEVNLLTATLLGFSRSASNIVHATMLLEDNTTFLFWMYILEEKVLGNAIHFNFFSGFAQRNFYAAGFLNFDCIGFRTLPDVSTSSDLRRLLFHKSKYGSSVD